MDDDDKARMANTEAKLLGVTVTKLLTVSLPGPVKRFVDEMDLQLNVFGRSVSRDQVQRIKDLAWEYRRQMPKHLAPKLPPHDPIVREMGEQ